MLYWILFVTSLACVIFFTMHWDIWRWLRVPIVNGLDIAGVPLVVFVCTLISPMFWEFPIVGAETILVGKDGHISDRSRFLGVPDLPWGDDAVVNLQFDPYMGKVTIQPVTANPKVRHLVSVVDAHIVNSQQYIKALPESLNFKEWVMPGPKLNGGRILVNQIESALYEFHEKYSQELGKFYNPHDANQQAEFRALAISAIGPILTRKGIEVTNARFEM